MTVSNPPDDRSIVWLDIDNTLYSSSHRIADLMSERIQAYFESMPGNYTKEAAKDLATHYYTEYGLAIRGLIKHHKIDPEDFDKRCDQSLPLEEILKPNPQVTKLLEDFDRSKTRVWALTNAGAFHANRVLKILRLDELVETIVYCNYLEAGSESDISCKPEKRFYKDAVVQAGNPPPSKCYFVDDSLKNVVAAKQLEWHSCVYYRESRTDNPDQIADPQPKPVEGVDATIGSLEELRGLWPELFKAASQS